MRAISDSFLANELQEHSERVIDRVRKQVIMLLAAESATKLILERPNDRLAQLISLELGTRSVTFRSFKVKCRS